MSDLIEQIEALPSLVGNSYFRTDPVTNEMIEIVDLAAVLAILEAASPAPLDADADLRRLSVMVPMIERMDRPTIEWLVARLQDRLAATAETRTVTE